MKLSDLNRKVTLHELLPQQNDMGAIVTNAGTKICDVWANRRSKYSKIENGEKVFIKDEKTYAIRKRNNLDGDIVLVDNGTEYEIYYIDKDKEPFYILHAKALM